MTKKPTQKFSISTVLKEFQSPKIILDLENSPLSFTKCVSKQSDKAKGNEEIFINEW